MWAFSDCSKRQTLRTIGIPNRGNIRLQNEVKLTAAPLTVCEIQREFLRLSITPSSTLPKIFSVSLLNDSVVYGPRAFTRAVCPGFSSVSIHFDQRSLSKPVKVRTQLRWSGRYAHAFAVLGDFSFYISLSTRCTHFCFYIPDTHTNNSRMYFSSCNETNSSTKSHRHNNRPGDF